MHLPVCIQGWKKRNCTGPVKVGMLFWPLLDRISFVVVIMRQSLAEKVSLLLCSFEVQHEVTSKHHFLISLLPSASTLFLFAPLCSQDLQLLFPRSLLLNPIQKEFRPPTSTKLTVGLLKSLGENLRLILAGATGGEK